MKKALLVAVCAIITITGVLIMLSYSKESNDEQEEIVVDLTGVGVFSLANHKRSIENPVVNEYLHPERIEVENIGIIDNAQTAIERAKGLWRDIYGGEPSFNESYTVRVFYDAREDCWYLYSELPEGMLGSAPHIIVRSNGDVIAVWHDGIVIILPE